MLSYHADMDALTNPYELGLDRLVDLEMSADYIGKSSLSAIKETGITRSQVGLIIEGAPLPGPNTEFWPVSVGGEVIGKVTSAVYSPRLKLNIALAMVSIDIANIGTNCAVAMPSEQRMATIAPKPFYDPKKRIAAG
jgi:aminomethyltransferase